MVKVNFIRDTETLSVDVPVGRTIMEAAKDLNLREIPADCGGCCACATCHVYISDKWLNKLKQKDDEEESMLDQAFDVKNNSRLSCQIELSEELDGLELELAPE